jgi:hypothetical protein
MTDFEARARTAAQRAQGEIAMVEIPEAETVVTRRRTQHRARAALAGAAIALVLVGGTVTAVAASHTGSGTHAPVAVQPSVEKPRLEFREVLQDGPVSGAGCSIKGAHPVQPGAPVVRFDRAHTHCYLLGPTLLTGADVDQAQATQDAATGSWSVDVHFKDNEFVTKVAQPYQGKSVAIVVDDVVLSAPTVNPGITDNEVSIAGDFTRLDAIRLASAFLGQAPPKSLPTSTTVPQASAQHIVVPDVVGMTQTDVAQSLALAGLKLASVQRCTSANSNVGVQQSPTAGTIVAAGATVTVTFTVRCDGSTSPGAGASVTVPNLVLMYPPDALNALQALGLHGTLVDKCVVRYQNDVQGTDPPAGSHVAPGTTVAVYVGIVCDPNSTVPTPTTAPTTPGT